MAGKSDYTFSTAINKIFMKVPCRIGSGHGGEAAKKCVRRLSSHGNFLKHGEGDTIIDVTYICDLRLGTGVLRSEVVRWES